MPAHFDRFDLFRRVRVRVRAQAEGRRPMSASSGSDAGADADAVGLVIAPGRTKRAWDRGRRSRTLYSERELDESLLDLDVDALRARLGLSESAGS
jgi:hypothetical protein